MNRGQVAIVSAILTVFIGCSSKKELNQSNAKSFLKEAIARDNRELMLAPMEPLKKGLTKDWTFTDYKAMVPNGNDEASLFKRMLDAGYLDQKNMVSTYPDPAGEYKADVQQMPKTYAGTPKPSHIVYSLNLSTLPSSLFVSVQYNYHLWAPSGQELQRADGKAKGTLGNDVISINFPWGTLPGGDFKISRDGGAVNLTGPSPTGTITLSGRANAGQIGVTRYAYSPSDKLLKSETAKCGKDQGQGDNCFVLGKIVVDDVGELLLDSAVSSSGSFRWHSELSMLGTAIRAPGAPDNGTGAVRFRKQSDGDWVLTSWSYR